MQQPRTQRSALRDIDTLINQYEGYIRQANKPKAQAQDDQNTPVQGAADHNTIHTDCAAVISAQKHKERTLGAASPHGHAWKHITDEGWGHPILKVKAHRTKEQAMATGDIHHYNGNWWADKLCNTRAKELTPPEAELHLAIQAWHTTSLQAAIKTTEAWEPTRQRSWEASRLAYQARSPAPPGEPIRKHRYEWHPRLRRHICSRCMRTRTQGGPHCPAVPTHLLAIAYRAAKLGHHPLMSTPANLRHDTPSIVACATCTRYSQRRAQGLAKRCQGPDAANKTYTRTTCRLGSTLSVENP